MKRFFFCFTFCFLFYIIGFTQIKSDPFIKLTDPLSEVNSVSTAQKFIIGSTCKTCTLMINNLLDNKEPKNMLRQAWQICNEIYRLTKKVDKEDGELEEYREKNLLYKKYIENLQERAHELRRSMNVSNNILKAKFKEYLVTYKLRNKDGTGLFTD
jgi:peptidoglycan hydrolase CwlO-like protein